MKIALTEKFLLEKKVGDFQNSKKSPNKVIF